MDVSLPHCDASAPAPARRFPLGVHTPMQQRGLSAAVSHLGPAQLPPRASPAAHLVSCTQHDGSRQSTVLPRQSATTRTWERQTRRGIDDLKNSIELVGQKYIHGNLNVTFFALPILSSFPTRLWRGRGATGTQIQVLTVAVAQLERAAARGGDCEARHERHSSDGEHMRMWIEAARQGGVRAEQGL